MIVLGVPGAVKIDEGVMAEAKDGVLGCRLSLFYLSRAAEASLTTADFFDYARSG